MPRPVNKNHRYVSGLDGIRTIAVALVLLYHLHIPGFSGGLLGVGVFFTLSGYLITTNLMRSWVKHGNLGLKTFWLRRFRRLMPAVILTLISVLILTATLDKQNLKERSLEALSSLFYVNNWHMIFEKKSYFDNFNGPSPLSHMWSLSIEEQFYLFWPLILLLLLTVLRKRVFVTVAAVVLSCLSFFLMWQFAVPSLDNSRAYEGTDTRAGGLLLGAALAIWLSSRLGGGNRTAASGSGIVGAGGNQAGGSLVGGGWLAGHSNGNGRKAKILADLAGLVGLAGIISLAVLMPQESLFLYHGGLILVAVCSLLTILSVLNSRSLWAKILGWTPMRWLGERSYGIYLWHMPVIAFMPQEWIERNRLLAGIITAGASVIIAALSWSLVEDPIRQHGVIPPIKKWLSSKHVQKMGAQQTSTQPIDMQKPNAHKLGVQKPEKETSQQVVTPFPTFFTSATAVILVAILSIGATPVTLRDAQSLSASGVPQDMELKPENMPDEAGNGAKADAGGNDGTQGASEENGAENDVDQGENEDEGNNSPESKPTSCTRVVHVGDSTSIGMFSENQVNTPESTAYTTYRNHGVEDVITSVFGARNTTEGFTTPEGTYYPSAVESVTELVNTVPQEGTCWVIAVGVNDAANVAVGAQIGLDERFDRLFEVLGRDAKVLWPMVTTNTDSGYYARSNMELFNQALQRAMDRYPNLRSYDWPSECDYNWFAPGDYSHYGPEGNTALHN